MLREPVLHFLLVGFVLYWLIETLSPEVNQRRIAITPQSLGEFVQFRSQAFVEDPDAQIRSMSPQALNAVIQQFVTEEALYREALALGMDQQDYVIRRRLVQKMEFLAESPALEEPSHEELEAYFAEHREAFRDPDRLTFTHVFLDQEIHGENLDDVASALLTQLISGDNGFTEAPGFGDQFPYHVNYVERSKQEIAAHFGTGFAAAVFANDFRLERWQGPLPSAFGQHLVFVRKRIPAEPPSFEVVFDRVSAAYRGEAMAKLRQSAIADVLAQYEVEIDEPLRAQLGEAP